MQNGNQEAAAAFNFNKAHASPEINRAAAQTANGLRFSLAFGVSSYQRKGHGQTKNTTGPEIE